MGTVAALAISALIILQKRQTRSADCKFFRQRTGGQLQTDQTGLPATPVSPVLDYFQLMDDCENDDGDTQKQWQLCFIQMPVQYVHPMAVIGGTWSVTGKCDQMMARSMAR